MKYCTKCGQQIDDEAVICPKCGCVTDEKAFKKSKGENDSIIRTLAKVFMILGCIAYGAFIIPLCWTVPMTVHYFRCCRENQPVSTAFKVCSILFVSLVGGILMFFDNTND